MPSTRSKRNSRKQSRGKSNRDVPVMPKRTFTTISCPVPRVHDNCSVRCVVNATVTATAATAATPTYYFTLAQTYTAMTSVFDKYLIEAIRFTITPQQNACGTLGLGLTDLYCIIDYDDANALTLSTMSKNANVIKLSPGESLQRTFRPKVAVAVYNGAFSGFAQPGEMWIDCASTSVEHYGVKLYIPPTNNAGQTAFQIWDVQMEYYVKFKNAI